MALPDPNPSKLLRRKLGDWWQDERRNWCAYCGLPMGRRPGHERKPSGATRDHLIPRAHHGGFLCIPACRACNQAKGSVDLAEFLQSPYFQSIRTKRHRHQWPAAHLWTALALAALVQAERADGS